MQAADVRRMLATATASPGDRAKAHAYANDARQAVQAVRTSATKAAEASTAAAAAAAAATAKQVRMNDNVAIVTKEGPSTRDAALTAARSRGDTAVRNAVLSRTAAAASSDAAKQAAIDTATAMLNLKKLGMLGNIGESGTIMVAMIGNFGVGEGEIVRG